MISQGRISFVARKTTPTAHEASYWIDLGADPHGGVIKKHNGLNWIPLFEDDKQVEINNIQEAITKLFVMMESKADKNSINNEAVIVENNLSSANAKHALSAAQGKQLKSLIDSLTSRVKALEKTIN